MPPGPAVGFKTHVHALFKNIAARVPDGYRNRRGAYLTCPVHNRAGHVFLSRHAFPCFLSPAHPHALRRGHAEPLSRGTRTQSRRARRGPRHTTLQPGLSQHVGCFRSKHHANGKIRTHDSPAVPNLYILYGLAHRRILQSRKDGGGFLSFLKRSRVDSPHIVNGNQIVHGRGRGTVHTVYVARGVLNARAHQPLGGVKDGHIAHVPHVGLGPALAKHGGGQLNCLGLRDLTLLDPRELGLAARRGDHALDAGCGYKAPHGSDPVRPSLGRYERFGGAQFGYVILAQHPGRARKHREFTGAYGMVKGAHYHALNRVALSLNSVGYEYKFLRISGGAPYGAVGGKVLEYRRGRSEVL